jgi:hypothetical protein
MNLRLSTLSNLLKVKLILEQMHQSDGNTQYEHDLIEHLQETLESWLTNAYKPK